MISDVEKFVEKWGRPVTVFIAEDFYQLPLIEFTWVSKFVPIFQTWTMMTPKTGSYNTRYTLSIPE